MNPVIHQTIQKFLDHGLDRGGVEMGTPIAPNFVNLFMANFKEKHILTFSSQPTFYKR